MPITSAPWMTTTAEPSSSSTLRIPTTIHGVGRWERLGISDAELAFVVEDAYQGKGLGRKLIEATIERAREEGFTRLVTDVLRSNHRMRHLARDYGLLIAEL
jgi:GNAT superfamily N-acetyltransferase